MKSLQFLFLSLLVLSFQAFAFEVNWASSNLTVSEGVGSYTIDVVLDANATSNVLVDYAIENGTAIGDGLDIDLAAEGNLVIATGSNQQSLTFNVVGDNVLEAMTESLEIQLIAASGANIGSLANVMLNLVDDDTPSDLKVFFAWNERSDDEGNLVSNIPVYLNAPSLQTVTVDVLFGGDVDSSDYQTGTNTITFAPGATKALFAMGLINDTMEESTENLILNLDSPSGANLLSGSEVFTYTIFDDDSLNVEMVTSKLDIVEGYSQAIYVRLNRPATRTCSVDYTITDIDTLYGNDYSSSQSGTLTFYAGEDEASITIAAIKDGEAEGREFLDVVLSNPTNVNLGSLNTTSVSFRDSRPALSISGSSSSIVDAITGTEGYAGPVLYVSIEDGAITQEVTVQLTFTGNAIEGVDYSAVQEVTIPANDNQTSFAVSILDDLDVEGLEDFTITLSSASRALIGSSDNVKIFLYDNDDETYESYLSSSYSSVNENLGATTLSLFTNGAVNRDVTYVIGQIGGNATEGIDYSLGSNVLTISSGSSSVTTTLTFNDDFDLEGDEDLVLGVLSASHGLIRSGNSHSFTLLDNDTEMYEAYLSSSYSSVNEYQGVTTLYLYTSEVVNRDVTYVIGQIGGNATEGTDYSLGSNVLTVTSGSSSATTTLTFNDDLEQEGSEDLIFGFESVSHGLLSSSNTHSFTLLDNDDESYEAYLASSYSSRNENDGSWTIYLYTTQPVNQDVTYVIDQISGNALLGDDVSLASNVLVVPAFSNSAYTTLSLIDDGLVEGEEDITIGITSANQGLILSSNTFTVSIIDDDTPPTINITSASTLITEGASNGSFYLSLDREFSSTLDLVLSSSGNATEAADFTLSDNTPSFAPGVTSKIIYIYPVDDGSIEGDEEIILSLEAATNVVLGVTDNVSISLIDNDDDPVSSEAYLQASVASIGENATSFSYRVVLNTPANVPLTYLIGDFGGNAILGDDFDFVSGNTITVAAYSTVSSYETISITNDGNTEGDEIIEMGILSSDNGTISSSNTFQVTLVDDETLPEVYFSSFGSVQETTSSLAVVAYLDRSYSGNVSVVLGESGTATSGMDYILSSNVLTFSSYSTSAIVYLSPINDTEAETDEAVTLSMTSAANAIIRSGFEDFLTTIYDNDSPTINLYSYSSVGEESTGQQFYVTLSEASDKEVYANVEITGGTVEQGTDFSGNAMTITFSPGSTTQYLDFQLINDDVMESTETMEASLLEVVNATVGIAQASVSLIDDDAASLVSLSSYYYTTGNVISNTENNQNTVYFRLDQVLPWDVYVEYSLGGTATRTEDYSTSDNGMVRIPAGSTYGPNPIYLRGIDDPTDEAEETVTVNIDQVYGAGLSGTDGQFVWNVQDNDEFVGPLLSFGSIPKTVMENASSNVISIPVFLNFPQDQDVSFSVGLNSSNTTATVGTDFLFDTSSQTMNMGTDRVNLTLTLLEDGVVESLEFIELVLQVESGANLQQPSIHRIALADADVFTLVAQDAEVINESFIYESEQRIDLALTGGEGSFSYEFGSESEHGDASTWGVFSLTSTGNVIHLSVPTIANPTEYSIIIEANSGNLTTSVNLMLLSPLSLSHSSVSVRAGQAGAVVNLSGASTSAMPARLMNSESGNLVVTLRDELVSLIPAPGALVSADEMNPTVATLTFTDAVFPDQVVTMYVEILPDTSNGTFLDHELQVPAYNTSSDYRLVGFPMKNMSAANLLDTLVPSFGAMNDLSWMLYEYQGISGNYSQVIRSSTLQTGQGFWMASTTTRQSDIAMIAVADNIEVQISLNGGWNILGNPYAVALEKGDFQVSDNLGQWVDLDSDQGYTAKTLWTFNDGTYASADNLSIGQAAWLYVWSTEGIDVRIDPMLADDLTLANMVDNSMNVSDSVAMSSMTIAKPRASALPEPYPPAPPSGTSVSGSSSGGGGCLLSNPKN